MPNIWVSRTVAYTLYWLFYGIMRVGKLFSDGRCGILPKSTSIRPSQTLFIPSSKCSERLIKIDVYKPDAEGGPLDSNGKLKPEPLPVHVNFHGSGFVLPVHGCDAEFCKYWAEKLGCIVFDVDYAKAPFHPAPAALDDALDALSYIASKPHLYDTKRVSLGGFSSGANIAILAALWTDKKALDVKGVLAWYPPTNLTRAGHPNLDKSFRHQIHRCLRQSYLPPGTDASTPRISPYFAASEKFPPLTLIVGSEDKLLLDSVDLQKKLEGEGMESVLSIIPGAGHAWERFLSPGTALWSEREKALALSETRLRAAYA